METVAVLHFIVTVRRFTYYVRRPFVVRLRRYVYVRSIHLVSFRDSKTEDRRHNFYAKILGFFSDIFTKKRMRLIESRKHHDARENCPSLVLLARHQVACTHRHSESSCVHACTRCLGPRMRPRMCTRACFTLRTRINMYTRACTLTDADARDRGVAALHRLSFSSPVAPIPVSLYTSLPVLVQSLAALAHLQTFAYKYTGYLDGWYAD